MTRDKMDEINADLNFGFFKIGGKWKPDESERQASWEIYVELATRLTLVPFSHDAGSVRESIQSLRNFFGEAREILKRSGATVARPKDGQMSIASLTIDILNGPLRQFLSKWHTKLTDYEHSREAGVSLVAHEKQWSELELFCTELKALQDGMSQYASLLAKAAEVEHLHNRYAISLTTNNAHPSIAPPAINSRINVC